jgi:hypothetical protein
MGYGIVNLIYLPYDAIEWWVFVNVTTNHRVPKDAECLLVN